MKKNLTKVLFLSLSFSFLSNAYAMESHSEGGGGAGEIPADDDSQENIHHRLRARRDIFELINILYTFLSSQPHVPGVSDREDKSLLHLQESFQQDPEEMDGIYIEMRDSFTGMLQFGNWKEHLADVATSVSTYLRTREPAKSKKIDDLVAKMLKMTQFES